MPASTFRPCLAAIVLAIVLSTGCGSSDPRNNDYVQYSGNALRVEGVDYPRDLDSGGSYARGHILVTPKEGEHDDAVAALARYGLTVTGTTDKGVLVATVPEGFEWQWQAALSNTPSVRFTATDDATSSIAQTAVAATPASTETSADGAPVPEGEPPADEVRRLTHELYAEMETAGGAQLTQTATDTAFVVRTQLADVQPDGCKQLPGANPGEYSCSVLLKVRSCNGAGCDPSNEEALDDAKRINIRWDPSGKWMRG